MRVLDAGTAAAVRSASCIRPIQTPDPEYPLVMVMCLDCRLVQLESDPTTPEEPRGLEPGRLSSRPRRQSMMPETRVRPTRNAGPEYPSPHGGSWVEQLERRSLIEVSQGPAELLVDIFGMMHDADQRAALTRPGIADESRTRSC